MTGYFINYMIILKNSFVKIYDKKINNYKNKYVKN